MDAALDVDELEADVAARLVGREGERIVAAPLHRHDAVEALHHVERHPQHGRVVLEPVEVGHGHVGVVEDRAMQPVLAVDVVRREQAVVRLHTHGVAASHRLARPGHEPVDVHRVRLPRPALGVAPEIDELDAGDPESLAEPGCERLGDVGETAHEGVREADLAVSAAASGPS